MITLSGKYNCANIFLDDPDVDQGIRDQIQTFLDHPAFKGSYIAIMPDTHVGTGCVIGFTMKVNDYLIPNLTGVDIGCGITTYNLGLKRNEINVEDFDKLVIERIPMGMKKRNKPIDKYMQPIYLEVANKIGVDEVIVRHSIGTGGGGNHFLELDVDENDNVWLTVHTGSRNFGLRIANYWQAMAKKMCDTFFCQIPAGLEFLPINMGGSDYLSDMMVAQHYAISNRLAIYDAILGDSFKPIANVNFISSVHNYISAEDSIIRKGAISAHEGEKCIIPFNGREGVAICTGKGNKKYNFSAPHGAGRAHSRSKMTKMLKDGIISVSKYQEDMENAGVYTSTATGDTIDEMWMAYKDKDLILKHIEPTVKVDFFMKPIWNLKGGGKD